MTDLTAFDTEAAVVGELAQRANQGVAVRDGMHVFVTDHGVQTVDHTEHKTDANPQRARGTRIFRDAASMCQFINSVNTETCHVYGDETTGNFTAVLNDDHGDVPGWRDFRAQYEPTKTPEYVDWMGIDGRYYEQDEIAEFLDSHRPDVTDPVAADLMEIVQTLQVSKGADFGRAIRLDNGEVQFNYREEVSGKAGRSGELHIPEKISVTLAPWYGTDAVEFEAFFRYRMSDGNLRLGFKFINADRIVNALVHDIADMIKVATGVEVWWGTPPAPLV